MKCKYCGEGLPKKYGLNPENCSKKPFTVTLTREEILSLLSSPPYTARRAETLRKLGTLVRLKKEEKEADELKNDM